VKTDAFHSKLFMDKRKLAQVVGAVRKIGMAASHAESPML
jgi:hypothetical protein